MERPAITSSVRSALLAIMADAGAMVEEREGTESKPDKAWNGRVHRGISFLRELRRRHGLRLLKEAGAPSPGAGIQCTAAERVMLIREVAPRRAVGLAIDRTPHLSTERCRECGAELRDAVACEIQRDGATLLADVCRYCDTPNHLVRKDVLL